MAGIVSTGRSFIWCGGSVINDQYILTSARCIKDETPASIQVLLGEHDRTRPDGEQRFDVAKIIVHSGYIYETYEYDFALLKLKKTIS